MQPYVAAPWKATAGKYLRAGANSWGPLLDPGEMVPNHFWEMIHRSYSCKSKVRHVKRMNLGAKIWRCLDLRLLFPRIQPCRQKDIRTSGAHSHTFPVFCIKSSWSCNLSLLNALYRWENWGSGQWSDFAQVQAAESISSSPLLSTAFMKDHLLSPWLCYGV